jgi:predicted nucleic acid-binding Zn ribbon protein
MLFLTALSIASAMPNIQETWRDPDEWDDEEDDLVDYGDDDDEEATIRCPYCRAEIWEEAQQCPECGEYLSLEDRRSRHEWQPRWIILTAIMLLLLFGLGALAMW